MRHAILGAIGLRCMSVECGYLLRRIFNNNCGGLGDIYGCDECKAVFEQTTSGAASAKSGVTFKKLGVTLDIYKGPMGSST